MREGEGPVSAEKKWPARRRASRTKSTASSSNSSGAPRAPWRIITIITGAPASTMTAASVTAEAATSTTRFSKPVSICLAVSLFYLLFADIAAVSTFYWIIYYSGKLRIRLCTLY